MATDLRPMLCHSAGQPPVLPTGDDWVMEKKYDGWRFLFEVREDGVRSYGGRNGADHSGKPRAIEAALARHVPPGTVLDCELIVEGESSPQVSTALANGGRGLVAYVFDVLYLLGRDVRGLPWSERQAYLERLADEWPATGPNKVPLRLTNPGAGEPRAV